MTEDNLFFLGVAAVFLALLVVEWRYRFTSIRIGTAVLALATFLFFSPLYHAAWRRAISMPEEKRATVWPGEEGQRLTEYQSGVFTMYHAVVENAESYAGERNVAVSVLFWLACSPGLRRTRHAPDRHHPAAPSSAVAPEA